MKRPITAALASAVVLAIGALALSGCAQPNTGSSDSSTASLPLVGWKRVAASTLQDGGTLNLAVGSSGTDAGNWNINTTQGAEVDVTNLVAPLQGAPLIATDNGGTKVNPDYAESVTLTSTTPETISVKLNPKAVWQDGSPLTANDYKATWAALSGNNTAFNLASSAGYSQVNSFDVTGDYSFTFTFSTPYADWQNLLVAPALPAAVASDPNQWNNSFVSQPVPSSGPFIMSKLDNNAKVYTETRNPRWWGSTPRLSAITWTVIDQSSQAQAFANNEINAVSVSDVDTYVSALKKANSQALRSGGVTYAQVTFNGTQAPLNDVHVRKAIAQAIDRDLISKTANSPLGVKAVTDGNWIFMPGQNGYVDTMNNKLPYDQSAAKSQLEDGGWKNSNGAWTKDGKTLKLTITVPQGTKSNELRAQQIQASLKQIDIPVTLNEVPSSDYFTNIQNGQFQMATFAWQGTLFPISTAESLFYPAGKPGGTGQNYSYITDKRLGDLWNKANTELNASKRLEIANDINNVIAEFVPMVPIYPYPNVEVVDGNLANYGPATFASTDWTQVGFTK